MNSHHSPAKSFRDLPVWASARRLVPMTYNLAKPFPPHERYGVAGQMQRAAVSVAVNVAEGWGRGSRGELHRFVTIALGSLHELDALTDIVEDLQYASQEDLAALRAAISEVGRMLTGLRRALRIKRAVR